MSKMPEVMPFERVDGTNTRDCFYKRIGFGIPRKGQWYISGAIPMAYRAPNDLRISFLIVEPTHFAKLVTRQERGDAVPMSAEQRRAP